MKISGQTAEEYFEYECKDEKAKKFYEELMAEKDSDYSELLKMEVDKETERLSEHLYFARELVSAIQENMAYETNLRKLKSNVRNLIEESYFEL